MRSPGRAPKRKQRLAFGTVPKTTMSARNSVGRLRGVAAGEDHGVFLRQGEQTAGETVYPTLWQAARQSQREKSGERFSPHGSDVAETSRQAAVANRFR